MDCNNEDGDEWAWENGLYCDEKSTIDESCSFWNEVSLDKDQHSCLLDETTTPARACGMAACHADSSGNLRKESEEKRESYHCKRRRMLQFTAQVADSHHCSDEILAFTKSNDVQDSLDEILPAADKWCMSFPDASTSNYEPADHQAEQWFSDCLNDCDMNFSSDTLNLAEQCNLQIDISEFLAAAPESETKPAKKPAGKCNVVFKGTKSFVPAKSDSSVAYPFAIIKPCGIEGDVTLKDINRRIRSPPSSDVHQKDGGAFPTSAFSGKPVVGKTKILTDGGKGSITIMRTKG